MFTMRESFGTVFFLERRWCFFLLRKALEVVSAFTEVNIQRPFFLYDRVLYWYQNSKGGRQNEYCTFFKSTGHHHGECGHSDCGCRCFFLSSAQSCGSFLYLRPSHCASSFLAFFGCNLSDGIEYPFADYVLFFCKPCLCL